MSVDVSGLSPSTSEADLHDFFSFCGRIESVEIKGDDEAVISFEQQSAAYTALMLSGGNLGGSTLTVTSETNRADHDDGEDHPHIGQSDKPRAGIAAEYLAKSHKLSENTLQRGIEIDNDRGISIKCLAFLSDLDRSVGQRAIGPEQTVSAKVESTFKEAHIRAKNMDEQKGYSKAAREYYAKALASPFGQSVMSISTFTLWRGQSPLPADWMSRYATLHWLSQPVATPPGQLSRPVIPDPAMPHPRPQRSSVLPRCIFLLLVALVVLSLVVLSLVALSLVALSLVPLFFVALFFIALLLIPLSLVAPPIVALIVAAISPIALPLIAVFPISLPLVALSPIPLSLAALTPIALTLITLSPIALLLAALSPIALSLTALSPIALSLAAFSSVALSLIPLIPIALSLIRMTLPVVWIFLRLFSYALQISFLIPRILLFRKTRSHPRDEMSEACVH